MTHPLTGKRVANEHGMVGTILMVRNGMAHIEYTRWSLDDITADGECYTVFVINLADLERPAPPPAPEIDTRFPDVD